METLLFVLFLVGIQVAGSILEARKKKRQYEEQMRRMPPQTQTYADREEMSRPRFDEQDEEFDEEEEEEPFFDSAPASPPPFSQPNPSPVPDGMKQLQDVFRKLMEREEELKNSRRPVPPPTPAIARTAPPSPVNAPSSFDLEGGGLALHLRQAEKSHPHRAEFEPSTPPLDRSRLREAILYSEILGKPKALRRTSLQR